MLKAWTTPSQSKQRDYLSLLSLSTTSLTYRPQSIRCKLQQNKNNCRHSRKYKEGALVIYAVVEDFQSKLLFFVFQGCFFRMRLRKAQKVNYVDFQF